MKELDNLDNFGSARDLNYSQELSAVQDVDYVKAISDFTQKQTTLQAAQQSFVKVTGLSLFNYL
jgi:flagellar hook-associated protein 3 FlgL